MVRFNIEQLQSAGINPNKVEKEPINVQQLNGILKNLRVDLLELQERLALLEARFEEGR